MASRMAATMTAHNHDHGWLQQGRERFLPVGCNLIFVEIGQPCESILVPFFTGFFSHFQLCSVPCLRKDGFSGERLTQGNPVLEFLY